MRSFLFYLEGFPIPGKTRFQRIPRIDTFNIKLVFVALKVYIEVESKTFILEIFY